MTPDAMIAAVRAFRDTLRLRRTVREFSSDPVPPEAIELAIETAASAPSGANLQPWKFVVVTDPVVKREIRIAAEKEEQENYGGRMPEEWLRALAPLQTDWHKEFLEIARSSASYAARSSWTADAVTRMKSEAARTSKGLWRIELTTLPSRSLVASSS